MAPGRKLALRVSAGRAAARCTPRWRDAIAERERRRNPDPVRADTAAAHRAGDHDGIDGTDPFATAKPDARLIKLLIRARQFNATLLERVKQLTEADGGIGGAG